jgi:hypothetical protein
MVPTLWFLINVARKYARGFAVGEVLRSGVTAVMELCRWRKLFSGVTVVMFDAYVSTNRARVGVI